MRRQWAGAFDQTLSVVGLGPLLLSIQNGPRSRGSAVGVLPTSAVLSLVVVVAMPLPGVSVLIPRSASIAVAVAVAVVFAVPVSPLSVPRVWRPRAPSVSSLPRWRWRSIAGSTGFVIPTPFPPVVPHICEVILIFSATGLVITVFGIIATHVRQFAARSLRPIECWDGVVEQAAGRCPMLARLGARSRLRCQHASPLCNVDEIGVAIEKLMPANTAGSGPPSGAG